MLPYRTPTEAQRVALAAGRQLVGTALCRSCEQRFYREELTRGWCEECREAERWRDVAAEAQAWLALEPVFLDTETTGLDDADQIAEIAIRDQGGAVLFESLVRPSCPMSAAAAAVHGIPAAAIEAAPAWPEIYEAVRASLAGRIVIAHNADFDRGMLFQTCRAFGLDMPAIGGWRCTMELLSQLTRGRWPSLGSALAMAGVCPADGDAHRAGNDTESLRRLVFAVAARVA